MRILITLMALGSLGLLACGEPSNQVTVELVTDFVPGVEFESVLVTLTSLDGEVDFGTRNVEIDDEDVFLPGRRVAAFDDVSRGTVTLTLSLLNAEGEEVLYPALRVFGVVSGSQRKRVEVFRKCADVVCPPESDPTATQCYRGRCVAEMCFADEAQGACSIAECIVDDDCGTSIDCAVSRCVEGSCFEALDDALCEGDNVCNPEAGGCVAPEVERWSRVQRLQGSDVSVGDEFGAAVALAADGRLDGEDVLFVGAPGYADERGRVYVFVRRPGAAWEEEQVLECELCEPGDGFGTSIATASDGFTVLIGAPGDDSGSQTIGEGQSDNSQISAGAAYRYQLTASSVLEPVYIKAGNAAMTHEFGSSVAMGDRGAWYVVGAYRESSPGRGFAAASNDALSEGAPFSGALYGYLSNGVLSERLFVKASNADLNDWFGHSVAISGDESIVAAGAPAEASASLTAGPDDNSLRNTGAAYVFRRTAMEMEYLKAPDGLAAEGLFGFSVSLDNDGDRLLVGAPRAAEDGRAFLYSRVAADDVYGQPIELQAGYRANVISFGRALVLSPSGTLAFVSSEDRQGRVHVFGLDVDDTPPAGAGPEEWKVLQVLRSASPVAEEESFGAVISVDRQGRFVAVGAPEANSSASSIGGISPGSVYIFERESSAE